MVLTSPKLTIKGSNAPRNHSDIKGKHQCHIMFGPDITHAPWEISPDTRGTVPDLSQNSRRVFTA